MSRFLTTLAVVVCLFSFPAHAITRYWTGDVNANWSNAGNWSPAGVPVVSDSLVFPAGEPNTINFDLPDGSAVGAMTFNVAYTLNGNRMLLMNDISLAWNVVLTCNADVTLGHAVNGNAAYAEINFNGTVDTQSYALLAFGPRSTFNGAVSGSGTLGGVLQFTHDGTFSGSLRGEVDIRASMPNANLTDGNTLEGIGTLGTVNVLRVSPGTDSTPGVLQTKSITIRQDMWSTVFYDLVPGGTSDKLKVTGTVTLEPVPLAINVTGTAAAGQTFTLIDNDGSDPISGTFGSAAEGTTITVGSSLLKISYHGGDGNDVVLTAIQQKKTWTGAVSANWSDAQNWIPQGVPSSGEPLVFPAGASHTSMNNDLAPGFALGPISIDGAYVLSGNRIVLTDDFSSSYGRSFTFNTDVTLGRSVTSRDVNLTFNGRVDAGSYTFFLYGHTTFNGEVSGTGSLRGLLHFAHDATFSGSLVSLVELRDASLPNANLTEAGQLSGNGTLGNVNVQRLEPGTSGSPGVISTKSLSIEQEMASLVIFDLVPGATSDKMKVTGTVTIAPVVLIVNITGLPTPGQVFTLIDNDGTDAVSGTFSNTPEGATLTIGSSLFKISYRGGDGNDVVLTAAQTKKVWTGAVNANWSDPQNWNPQAIPVAGEELSFPSDAIRKTMNNDLAAGYIAGAWSFDANYTLNGNRIVLTKDLTFTTGGLVCNADLTISQSVSMRNGPVSFGGALSGSGTLTGSLHLAHDGTFSGSLNGIVELTSASMPDANLVDGTSLSGNGTLGNTTVRRLTPDGVLQTKSLTIVGDMFSLTEIDLRPAGTSDKLKVTGSVEIRNDVPLTISVASQPSFAQVFTLIDNDGSDSVNGTFRNLPEGTALNVGGNWFRLSYRGGDGNDVVLTTAAETSTSIAADSASTVFGEPVTFHATVTAALGTATGSVKFKEGSTLLATVPLQNGSAQFTTSAMHPATHSLTAVYDGEGAFFASNSSPLSHEVKRGQTTTAMTAGTTSITYGDSLSFAVNVAAAAPAAGTPSGSVAIRAGDASFGSSPLTSGAASISFKPHGGTYSFTAAYAGNGDFLPSDSSATSVTVAQAPVSLTVSADHNPVSAGHSVTLTVRAGSAAGTITVSEKEHVLAQQAIDGTATIKLRPLSAGEHDLTIAFGASDDYKPSSATTTIVVTKPAVAVDDLVVPEGDEQSKTVQIAVRLSDALTTPVDVAWSTVDGTAVAGHDYESASGTLTFGPGETQRAIPIVIHGDTTPEDEESFVVALSSVTANATLERASATVVIANDDAAWKKLGTFNYSGSLTLDLYAPPGGDARRPLVMWIPGLTSYGADGGASIALRQASRGYLVAVVRYREPAVARFPAQLDDLQAALRWLRANADQFQIISNRIAAWGNGTGAHLAALLGTAPGDQVQAVIDWNGASDLVALNADAGACSFVDHDDAASPESTLLGCPLPACPEMAKSASPMDLASAHDAAFLIMHGGENCFVSQSQSRKLHAALRSSGVDSLLYVLDGVGLVDPFWNSSTASSAVDEFLDSHLKNPPARHRPSR